MKLLAGALFLSSLSVFAQEGTTTPQGSTQPSATDIMGGGTPGRSEGSQISKEMYGSEDEVKKGQMIQKEEEIQQKDKTKPRKAGKKK